MPRPAWQHTSTAAVTAPASSSPPCNASKASGSVSRHPMHAGSVACSPTMQCKRAPQARSHLSIQERGGVPHATRADTTKRRNLCVRYTHVWVKNETVHIPPYSSTVDGESTAGLHLRLGGERERVGIGLVWFGTGPSPATVTASARRFAHAPQQYSRGSNIT